MGAMGKTDGCPHGNVHNVHKQPIGARLAMQIRRMRLGEDIVSQGPRVSSVTATQKAVQSMTSRCHSREQVRCTWAPLGIAQRVVAILLVSSMCPQMASLGSMDQLPNSKEVLFMCRSTCLQTPLHQASSGTQQIACI